MNVEKNESVELNRLINLVHVPEINREFNELHDRLKDKDIQRYLWPFCFPHPGYFSFIFN